MRWALLLLAGLTACPRPTPTTPIIKPTNTPVYSLSSLSAEDRALYQTLVETAPSPCEAPETLQASLEAKRCPDAVYLSRVAFRLYRDKVGTEEEITRYMLGFITTLQNNGAQRVTVELSAAPMRGVKDAPVALVEFADFECPHCAFLHTQLKKIWPQLDGATRFYYKNFPLSMHPNAEPAARAALAANQQGKFWEYYEILFSRQDRIEPGRFTDWARELNLDLDQFEADYASPALAKQVANDRQEAISLGLTHTPVLIIDQRPYLDRIEHECILDAVLFALAAHQQLEQPQPPQP